MHQLQPTQRTGFSYRFRHWSMSHCFERHRNSYRRTGAGLAWGGEGLDTSYRGSLAAQDVATPTTERPLIKWALAIKRRTRYYRCSGSDGYRFGGERICSNAQIQGELLETAV